MEASTSTKESAQLQSRPSCGLVSHELYFWHDSGLECYDRHFQPLKSCETPESKRRLLNLIRVTSLANSLIEIRPRQATVEELHRVHDPKYVKSIKDISSTTTCGDVIGEVAHFSPKGFDIAALSAGGVLKALEEVVAGACKRAYCLVRPPGHHAERDRARGFCIFNNIGVAAAHALTLGDKIRRVAIVDYDVHHGNGTESQFFERSDVLFISLHQDGLYPYDTGGLDATGAGEGLGYNLNVPLPPGSGIGCYEYAFNRVVLPALNEYRPDIILVSSGFDAAFADPLGRMCLRARDFGWMAAQLCEVADKFCDGKIVFTHEGGYSESYVPYCGLRVIEALAQEEVGVHDPFEFDVGAVRQLQLQEHQRKAVDQAAENLKIKLIEQGNHEY